MEELKHRGDKREERHRDTWDPFQLNPVGAEKEKSRTCFQVAQYLMAFIVGLAVLTSAVIAKGSLLVMSTLCSKTSLRSPKEKQFYTLMLVFTLVFPNFLMFMKSLWRCAFKSFVNPNMKTMAFICAVECLVSLGTSVLVLVVMPQFDVLTNLFISGGVCIISAIMQIGFRLQKEKWKIIFPICSLIFTVAGYGLLIFDYHVRVSLYVEKQSPDCFFYIGIGIFSSLLIALCWWENPLQATNRMQDILSELDGFRDFVFVISSILRIIVIGGVYLVYHWLIQDSIDWSNFNLLEDDWKLKQIGLGLFALQAFCSAACYWFGVVACKIHAVKMSFAMPVCCTGPAVLLLGMILFVTQVEELDGAKDGSIMEFCESLVSLSHEDTTPVVILEISRSICHTSLNSYYLQWPFSMLALEGVCMWLGFVSCTYYVWKIKVQRIERTSQLFVRRLYESAFIDLSLLLNTKMKVSRAQTNESNDEMQNAVIYLCATMWHETYDEMLAILTSMFRLDRYRGDPKEKHNDCFDFECHIYVDDAFMTEKDTEKRLVNSYVEDLIHVIIEVYRVFTNKEPDDVSINETPYGGRVMVVMPDGNMLFIHLKDKSLIRNKKRWSQIMYLYYLLGWKGYIVKNPPRILDHSRPSKANLISVDGESFLVPKYNQDDKRRFISDNHTYLLALDGDTDFQPKAVILLVDRLRMYDNVGAACGRIHPTGMGPMVWYQKFEYAVGHWLQKTSEHVFGCVLCSPGCFSLFRGSALMDDNVLKRYTTTATRAAQYVQYDQGEDRWLCTLLLQQGWRVEYNAASDAYTNSPQEFKEFYNQRRRWGPSTLANTLDLLHSGQETVKKNTSISRFYIFYQMFAVGSSILGPASVTLMIASAFQFVFKLEGTISIAVACIPPTFYIVVCFVAKSNTQITIAALMSVVYAFLMTASLFSIIGDMVVEGTFLTPTGVFLVSMTIMYMVTAILHPEEFGVIIYGLMYFICIPSGYLLLTIYSLVNMHVVTWGTRESNNTNGGVSCDSKDNPEEPWKISSEWGGGEQKKNQNVMCDRNCKLCCWDMKIQITQETEHPMFQQIKGQTTQSMIALTNHEDTQEIQVLHTEEENVEESKKLVPDKLKRMRTKYRDTDSMDSGNSTNSINKRSVSLSDSDDDDEDEDEDSDPEEHPVRDWVSPVKDLFLKKLTFGNIKRNLEEHIRCAIPSERCDEVRDELVTSLGETLNTLLNGVGPEDILTKNQLAELEYALTERARRILKNNNMKQLENKIMREIGKTLMAPQVEKLDEDEEDFWNKLIKRYLKPIENTKAHEEEVTRELKSLRNKAVFLYFIFNVLWVVATFFLQAIGSDVISIKIPKLYPNGTQSGEFLRVEPLSLMFLLSFAILLILQFLAMLYHRVYTLIHVVSYRSKEKDYKPEEDQEEEEGLTMVNLGINGDDFFQL